MNEKLKNEIKELVAEIIEVEVDELDDEKDFVLDYDVDSLRSIEILTRLEKLMDVKIQQEKLAEMKNLLSVYQIAEECMRS